MSKCRELCTPHRDPGMVQHDTGCLLSSSQPKQVSRTDRHLLSHEIVHRLHYIPPRLPHEGFNGFTQINLTELLKLVRALLTAAENHVSLEGYQSEQKHDDTWAHVSPTIYLSIPGPQCGMYSLQPQCLVAVPPEEKGVEGGEGTLHCCHSRVSERGTRVRGCRLQHELQTLLPHLQTQWMPLYTQPGHGDSVKYFHKARGKYYDKRG